MPPCTCSSPDALDWIRRVFRECVSDDRELLGFYLALITVACWMTAQIPQLILNFRQKSARGLSPWFLAQWLAGDSFNLIGCLATGDQAPTQTYTAVYFVLSDLALLCQYVYYRERRSGRRQRRGDADDEDSSNASLYDALRSEDGGESSGGESATDPRGRGEGARGSMSPIGGFVLASASALALAATAASRGDTDGAVASSGVLRSALQVDDCEYNGNPQWMQNFGRGVGYLATAFYLGGRFAQIAKNRRRRTTEGLSLTMFALAVTANLAYGTSVLCASKSTAAVMHAMPWLLGSFGTVVLDLTILASFPAASSLLSLFGRRRRRSVIGDENYE